MNRIITSNFGGLKIGRQFKTGTGIYQKISENLAKPISGYCLRYFTKRSKVHFPSNDIVGAIYNDY